MPAHQAPGHVPVLADRTIELLRPALAESAGDHGPRCFIDATLGLGGHAEKALRAIDDVHVIGIDRDPRALAAARARLDEFGGRFVAVHAVYDEIPAVLADLGIDRVDGVLFDLGVSSMQLDEAERGFAYAFDAPLDMRMDPGQERTAADVVNTYSEAELRRIFRDYGEERFAPRIARAIDRRRTREKFSSSGDLVDTIRMAIPAAARHAGGHPAKRVFQALRIEVNTELDVLARAIPAALQALRPAGRIVVLSYHSLEDRIVKRALTDASNEKTPIDLPTLLPEAAPTFRLLVRGSEQASESEIDHNPRAKSVRLRAAERIREVA